MPQSPRGSLNATDVEHLLYDAIKVCAVPLIGILLTYQSTLNINSTQGVIVSGVIAITVQVLRKTFAGDAADTPAQTSGSTHGQKSDANTPQS